MPANIRFRVFESPDSACAHVAAEIAQLIRDRALLGRTAVFGFSAGSSPLPLYSELIYLHREEGLSFANVITFNLDEYFGVGRQHLASFRAYMHRHLFDQVDIREENIHFPASSFADDDVETHCADYEKRISKAGGIDLQILGLGGHGKIGFNQIGTPADVRTHRVPLDEILQEELTSEFGEMLKVPKFAITMGCGTVLAAHKIAIFAWGTRKAGLVRRAIEGPISSTISASYFQTHPSACFFLDLPAASMLKQNS